MTTYHTKYLKSGRWMVIDDRYRTLKDEDGKPIIYQTEDEAWATMKMLNKLQETMTEDV